MDRNEIFTKALSLNGEDKRYQITVEDDMIITSVKWMDATLFSPGYVTDEVKQFKYIVKIHKNGKYTELDKSVITTKSGSGALNYNKKMFVGKQITFDKTVGIGKNHDDDSFGVVNETFYSEEYKKPVRDLLNTCGYKKKMGVLGKTFIIAGIIAVLIVAAVLMLIMNIDPKVAVSAEEFANISEENGYVVASDDKIIAQYPHMEKVLIAVNTDDNYQIEFYVVSDVNSAKGVFLNNKNSFEQEGNRVSKSATVKNYEYCETETDKYYMYVSRVDNTILYINVEKYFKDDVRAIVEEMGY